jgi:hypothetical protein
MRGCCLSSADFLFPDGSWKSAEFGKFRSRDLFGSNGFLNITTAQFIKGLYEKSLACLLVGQVTIGRAVRAALMVIRWSNNNTQKSLIPIGQRVGLFFLELKAQGNNAVAEALTELETLKAGGDEVEFLLL